MHPAVLVIDDQFARGTPWEDIFLNSRAPGERPVREALATFAFASGQVNGRNDVASVIERVRSRWPDRAGRALRAAPWALVLLDVRFDDAADVDGGTHFGFRLLDALRGEFGPDLPIVMLTSEDRSKRRAANERAADDFLAKDDLSAGAIDRMLLRVGLTPDPSGALSGTSLSLLKVLRDARRVATDLSARGCLLLGETGTGKSQLARYIHDVSGRGGPFVRWSATRNNDSLNEDALFGHWRGAHDQALSHEPGVIERAHGGTFLLDEVANLSGRMQEALLDIRRREHGLRMIRRLGTFPIGRAAAEADRSVCGVRSPDHRIGVDVIWVTATNERLDDPVERERLGFRQDLYADLGRTLRMPSLNDRRSDVPELFRSFVASSLPPGASVSIRDEVLEAVEAMDWTGANVVGVQRLAQAVVQNLGAGFDEILLRHLPGAVDRQRPSTVAGVAPNSARSFEDVLALLAAVEVPRERERLRALLPRYQEIFAMHVLEMVGHALRVTVDRRGRTSTLAALSLLLGRERLTPDGRGETTKSYDILKRLVLLSDVAYRRSSAPSTEPLSRDQLVIEHARAACNKR